MERPCNPPAFARHRLHDPQRCWPETNCYVDLWIEVLAATGEIPEAMLGFAAAQGFTDDQFTFSKPPIEDLHRLYGVAVRELSVWRTLEQHASIHVGNGDIVLLEVDAFHLPDTQATTYRRAHAKTTIAIDRIEPDAQRCGYFHNAARGELHGEDYLGAFRLRQEFRSQPDLLPPYFEVAARSAEAPDAASLRANARDLLACHLSRRPRRNPFSAWRAAFPGQLEELLSAPDLFHDYAFHFPRLAGSNFELLGDHASWLAAVELQDIAEACLRMAEAAKALQFRVARLVARGRTDACAECFDTLEADYERVIGGLDRYVS